MAQQKQAKGDKAGKKIVKRTKRSEYFTLECKASRLRSQATRARAKIRYLTRRAENGRPVTEQSTKSVLRDGTPMRERITRPIVGKVLANRIARLEAHAKRTEARAKVLDGGARIA